jgi:hypothetical protein
MPASTEHRNLHADLPTTSNGAHPSPSAVALKAAKQFAVYIEFFRTHGTGDLVRKYGEDECMAGYGMVVQRAFELAEFLNGLDGRAHTRTADGRHREAEAA